jgi:hypothetical protein
MCTSHSSKIEIDQHAQTQVAFHTPVSSLGVGARVNTQSVSFRATGFTTIELVAETHSVFCTTRKHVRLRTLPGFSAVELISAMLENLEANDSAEIKPLWVISQSPELLPMLLLLAAIGIDLSNVALECFQSAHESPEKRTGVNLKAMMDDIKSLDTVSYPLEQVALLLILFTFSEGVKHFPSDAFSHPIPLGIISNLLQEFNCVHASNLHKKSTPEVPLEISVREDVIQEIVAKLSNTTVNETSAFVRRTYSSLLALLSGVVGASSKYVTLTPPVVDLCYSTDNESWFGYTFTDSGTLIRANNIKVFH